MFNFQLDKATQGPTGPHLFRSSIGSSIYAKSTEIDLYFERSPRQPTFPESACTISNSPNRFPFSPSTPKALTTVHPDVSQVGADEILNWKPSQVAHWLYIAGFEDAIIEKFIVNDISGLVLVNLQLDDLKELDIQSFGKRHELMNSIEHLRETVCAKSQAEAQARKPRRRQSPQLTISPTGEILSNRGNTITPAESVSIVGIEQLLPKPHSCSKGENCPKYKRRQRKLEKLAAEYPGVIILPTGTSLITGNPGNPDTASNLLRPASEAEPSVVADPSVVASSDILGRFEQPTRLCEESLNEVKPLDRQENVRQFLNYQHVELSAPAKPTAPTVVVPDIAAPIEPYVPLSPPTTQTGHVAAHLRNLPKLTIPVDIGTDDMTTAQRTITPSMVARLYGSPTTTQDTNGPFSYGRYTSPADYYRQETPFSEMDVPITAIPNGPVARETSQSVPPDMRYGDMTNNGPSQPRDPSLRSASARPRAGSAVRKVHVEHRTPLTPIDVPEDYLIRTPRQHVHTGPSSSSTQQSSSSSSSALTMSTDPDVTRSGWMKKRKTTRLLRHEWHDAHFTLRGTNLAMHKDELEARRLSKALEVIDVDDFAVACSSLATSSKLTAAFKRSILRSSAHHAGSGHRANDAAFAFSLVPAGKEGESGKKTMLFGANSKSHHFAVKTRDERIDWMRELMLAKALRKGKEGGAEVRINGNVI